MKIQISKSVYDDLNDGYSFYEAQHDSLGNYFQETFVSNVESLNIYAGIHPKHFGKYRLLSKRFPYAIYYTMKADAIIISAILDCRKKPDWIRDKLT